MAISKILDHLSQRNDLEEAEAKEIMLEIMDGNWTPAQIAAFLMGLKSKGETVSEMTGFLHAMREKVTKIKGQENVIDTCGTGGDGASTFNISTAAAIIAAAAGVPVAKHGNRAVSSACGSADVLQELGVKIDLLPEQAQTCLLKVGIVFLFAPIYHPSMKHAGTPRREMGIRTVFNILGPLSNPAGAKRQLVGAFNLDTAKKMIQVLKNINCEHAIVVHSHDGLDELSLSTATHVFELKNGIIQEYDIGPEDVGLVRMSSSSIKGADAITNAKMLTSVLESESGPHADIAHLNAGAAIYIGGLADTIKEGVQLAKRATSSGRAQEKLAEFVEVSQGFIQNTV